MSQVVVVREGGAVVTDSDEAVLVVGTTKTTVREVEQNSTVITHQRPDTVIVPYADRGAQGPKGDKGDPGVPGKDGETQASFTYQQTTPVTITPTLAHGLDHYPQIELIQAGTGLRVTLFEAIFPTPQTVIITLLSPMAFTATMI